MKKKYSTSRAAQQLDVSTMTLKRWYKWYESDEFEKPEGLKLPSYERDKRGTRWFTEQALSQLSEFQTRLSKGDLKGCMSDFNARYCWGARGKKMLETKTKENENE